VKPYCFNPIKVDIREIIYAACCHARSACSMKMLIFKHQRVFTLNGLQSHLNF